jgi:K+-sensing histidine kinase KdpD
MARQKEAVVVTRASSGIGIEGEGIVWGVGAFAASILVGVALAPLRGSIGLENVTIVFLTVVALAGAVGGRLAGLLAALSAALSYDFFFTTPFNSLRIDSGEQVVTVVLLFGAGLVASLGGRAGRRSLARSREEEEAIRALHAIARAVASGDSPDRVAAERLRALLDARAVQVVRGNGQGDQVVAAAGEPLGDLDLLALPHLDDEGRLPSGHLRSVGGTLVLPAGGAVVDLVHDHARVGSLVVVPQPDRPILRSTRVALAAAAHALASC